MHRCGAYGNVLFFVLQNDISIKVYYDPFMKSPFAFAVAIGMFRLLSLVISALRMGKKVRKEQRSNKITLPLLFRSNCNKIHCNPFGQSVHPVYRVYTECSRQSCVLFNSFLFFAIRATTIVLPFHGYSILAWLRPLFCGSLESLLNYHANGIKRISTWTNLVDFYRSHCSCFGPEQVCCRLTFTDS